MRTWVPAQKPADNALWRFAGLPANRGMRLVEYLNQGLPVSVLDNIHEWTAMSKADILRVTGINERNVARRKSAGRTLTPMKANAWRVSFGCWMLPSITLAVKTTPGPGCNLRCEG